jgi:hypothetical protein
LVCFYSNSPICSVVFWVLTQAIIVFPILFPIHYIYSTNSSVDYAKTSLLRGDIASLVADGANPKGKQLLWIHLILIYFVTFSWMLNVYVCVSSLSCMA